MLKIKYIQLYIIAFGYVCVCVCNIPTVCYALEGFLTVPLFQVSALYNVGFI